MLVATNVIGQNTAAIAANEAMYGEMWAQDAAAMYGYAGTSAAASSVKAFSQPPETSNPAAQAMQGSAVTQANGASTGSGAALVISVIRARRRMRLRTQGVSAESSTSWTARTGTPSEPS